MLKRYLLPFVALLLVACTGNRPSATDAGGWHYDALMKVASVATPEVSLVCLLGDKTLQQASLVGPLFEGGAQVTVSSPNSPSLTFYGDPSPDRSGVAVEPAFIDAFKDLLVRNSTMTVTVRKTEEEKTIEIPVAGFREVTGLSAQEENAGVSSMSAFLQIGKKTGSKKTVGSR